MSNGITLRAGLAVALAAVLLSGCARDLISHPGFEATHASSNITAPERPSAPEGNVIKHNLWPVTGEPLDSMGGAIPVTVQGQTLYVCCQGCVKKVKGDPDRYIAIARSE